MHLASPASREGTDRLDANRAVNFLHNPNFFCGDRPRSPQNNNPRSPSPAVGRPYWQASQSSSSKLQTNPSTVVSISL